MAEELTPPTVNRRGVLKTLGAGVAVSTFANTTAAESEYDRVVDIVEAGADNTGAEPIDDVFSDVARDDTLVKFPAGRYRISQITVYGLTNFGMVGTDDTVLFPSEEYDPKLWIAGTNNRDLRFENFTIDNTEDGYDVFALPLAAGVLAPIGIQLSPVVGALLISLSTPIVAINVRLFRRVDRSIPSVPRTPPPR